MPLDKRPCGLPCQPGDSFGGLDGAQYLVGHWVAQRDGLAFHIGQRLGLGLGGFAGTWPKSVSAVASAIASFNLTSVMLAIMA
jgi:hypothetical protein